MCEAASILLAPREADAPLRWVVCPPAGLVDWDVYPEPPGCVLARFGKTGTRERVCFCCATSALWGPLVSLEERRVYALTLYAKSRAAKERVPFLDGDGIPLTGVELIAGVPTPVGGFRDVPLATSRLGWPLLFVHETDVPLCYGYHCPATGE